MASSKDFVANQIRAAKLIMTGTQPGDGGVGVGNIGLSIYDQSRALNNEGGVSDSSLYANLGSEVAILVSGSANYDGRDRDNTHVLFRGNLGTSGSMHFMNPSTHLSASVTLTFSNAPTATNRITFVTTDGTTKNFDVHGSTTNGGVDPALFSRGGSKHGADNLKTAIEGSSIASKVSVSSVAGSDPYTLTVTQVTAGAAGNTVIPSNLANVSVGGAPSASEGLFTGGSGFDNSPQQVFVFADHDRPNHLYLSGNLYAGGDKNDPHPYGTISGSIHHTRDGLPYLVGIGGISITSASNGQVTISGSVGGGGGADGMGTGFVLEDDSGDEVTITQGKEVKFIGAGGITTNWTDVSHGSDADPYDLTFTAADLTVAGDSGSTAMTLGDTLTIAGGTNCSTAMSGDTLTINATGGSDGMGAGFVIEDDDGTEVTITTNNEVKIIGGGGIVTNWTDVSPGSDADPYDLTITAPPVEYVFSVDSPSDFFKTVVNVKDDVVDATAESSAAPDGTAMGFLHNTTAEAAEANAVAFRVTVPTGYVAASTTIKFKVLASPTGVPGGSDKIELRIAGRHKETTGSPAISQNVNDNSTRGKWSDETGRTTGTASDKAPDGWFYFTNAAGISIPNNDFIIDSQTFLLKDIVNTAAAGSMQVGDIIDICLARNRGNDNAGQIGGVATSDDYGNKLLIFWVQVTITP